MSPIEYIVTKLSSLGRCVCFCEELKTNCPVYYKTDVVDRALCELLTLDFSRYKCLQ